MKHLIGHTSEETAYIVNDYPYGFRLRCKIRYWLEYSPKKGYRFCSQTTNPKLSTEVWNKPKKSTYVDLSAVMYLDPETDYVEWDAITKYSGLDKLKNYYSLHSEVIPKKEKALIEKLVEYFKSQELKRQNG